MVRSILTILLLLACVGSARAQETRPWAEISGLARGQTVRFNAWAGDPRTNDFIAWIGDLAKERHGVTIDHVKLRDTAEAVTRVLAEKTAGRNSGGSVDLIWLNGPNLLALKDRGLLFGPVLPALPNAPLIDMDGIPSNRIDFTVPVEGMAVPWRVARIAFLFDTARLPRAGMPGSMAGLLERAKARPGRVTHPKVRDFLGATFLKQALRELAPDPDALTRPATPEIFARQTEPLWRWYGELKPLLWRRGEIFPETGEAQRQLLADGEIDLMITFNPADAAVWIDRGLVPPTVRVAGLPGGTIGNTSFVAIPYNASAREGAMVVANLLLSPEAQARMRDPRVLGAESVLEPRHLPPLDAVTARDPALPAAGGLGPAQLEPHPSWMTMLVDAWERRYAR